MTTRTQAMLLRQWSIVQALTGQRRGKTAGALQRELGIPRATLYRDLKHLREAGVPLRQHQLNGEVRYALDAPPLPALAPDALELAALRLARASLAPLEGTALVDRLDALLQRWQEQPAPPAGVVRSRDRAGRSSPHVLERIEAALRQGRQLELEYRSGEAERPSHRTVDPAELRLAGEQVYLLAWDHERSDWRTFKVVRIRNARVRAEPASRRPGPSLDHAVRVWDAPSVDVTVRLDPGVADRAAEWPLHPDQRLAPQPDGSVLVHARVAGTVEASRWVLSWGGAAEALAPSDLRHRVRTELATALGHYARPLSKGHPSAAFPRAEAKGRD
ncbi:MAG: helix-turn-helix transcriptional regulator [Myxococcota bacterium]